MSKYHDVILILEVLCGKNNNIQFVEEFGKLTCWHIAHRDRWNEELCAKKPAAVSESKEDLSEDEAKQPKKRKSRKTMWMQAADTAF